MLTPCEIVRRLGYDLASFGVSITEIREMNLRELDYWAEPKRQKDAVYMKQADDYRKEKERIENAGR